MDWFSFTGVLLTGILIGAVLMILIVGFENYKYDLDDQDFVLRKPDEEEEDDLR